MKKKISLLFTLISILSIKAQTTSFETSEGYNLGNIDGQNGWMGWTQTNETLPVNYAKIVDNDATDGDFSLRFDSGSARLKSGVYKVLPNYEKIRISADLKIDPLSFFSGSDSFFTVHNEQTITTTDNLVGGFYFGPIALELKANDGQFSLHNYNSNTWYNCAMEFDFEAHELKFFMNDALIDTRTIDSSVTNLGAINFSFTDDGTGFTIDNVQITDLTSDLAVKDLNTLVETIKIYPNPSSDLVHINVDGKINSVEVLDLSGKIVKSLKGDKKTINISELPKGVYLLKVQIYDKVVAKKITKK